MTDNRPEVGQVIRYAYLWAREAEAGLEEGLKDRPTLVVAIAVTNRQGRTSVLVLPITHRHPDAPTDAVQIPARIKRQLGLDGEPSFFVTTEANAFRWPGPDLRFLKEGDDPTAIYGRVTKAFFVEVAASYAANRRRGAPMVRRTD